MRIPLLAALAVLTLSSPAYAFPIAPDTINNIQGLALKGFDPVAYFTDGKPEKGDPAITSRYQNMIYEFTNAEHKAMFEKQPTRYAPAFDGYCASGVANKLKIDIDPHAYAINAGELDLFFSEEARDDYQGDLAQKSAAAKKNWPAVRKMTDIIR
jgi:YHS domain-containing protein